ncbi:hypothetical protein FHR71_005433 [Methylobacterium sp. RAS18]|nr:hypothetical protein [Methylobacterium sp. RAS18]
MILDAVADLTTGVFSVDASAPKAEPMRAEPGPGILTGLLGEPRLIHTVTRQQRRHADRLRQKTEPNR